MSLLYNETTIGQGQAATDVLSVWSCRVLPLSGYNGSSESQFVAV